MEYEWTNCLRAVYIDEEASSLVLFMLAVLIIGAFFLVVFITVQLERIDTVLSKFTVSPEEKKETKNQGYVSIPII